MLKPPPTRDWTFPRGLVTQWLSRCENEGNGVICGFVESQNHGLTDADKPSSELTAHKVSDSQIILQTESPGADNGILRALGTKVKALMNLQMGSKTWMLPGHPSGPPLSQ